MAIYRVLRALEANGDVIRAGCFVRTGELSERVLTILEDRGAVARISPPPLVELPGWKTRAQRAEKAGILDAEQFLEADEKLLIETMKAKGSLISSWKAEISNWLMVPEAKKG